jgi:DNA replication protein DnaC
MPTECKTIWQRKWLELDVTNPALQDMATAIESFCRRWYLNEPSPSLLVLCGPCGVGKTHCAGRVAEWARYVAVPAMEAGNWGMKVPSVKFVRWPEITDAFKEGHYGVINDCNEVSFLIIDDIGAEHDPSRNAADKLCQILSHRERKFTLITTNISPAAWPERFDARIADRLMRNSRVVDLNNLSSYSVQ